MVLDSGFIEADFVMHVMQPEGLSDEQWEDTRPAWAGWLAGCVQPTGQQRWLAELVAELEGPRTMTLLAAQSLESASQFHACDIVRWLVGAVLLTAATMKGYELATGPVAEKGLLSSRWFLIVAVEFELALGLCLISGLWRCLAWWVAVLSFAGFACISAYKVWQGEVSCGCFGTAEIDPRSMLLFDGFVIGVLLSWRPGTRLFEWNSGDRRRLLCVSIFFVAVGGPMAWAISIPQNPTLQEPDKQPGLGAYIAIEPERWVGKRLPLLRHIDIADQLERGQWLVVLYASSDPQCQAMMPKYRQMAEELIDRGAIPRMALVEMPPYEQSRQNTIAAERFCLRGRLRDDQWFAPIPVEFKLVDGVVVASQAKGTGFTWLKRTVR